MTFTVDFSSVSKQLVKFANNEMLRVAANYLKEQERVQTLAGRDFEGRFFAPYKKSTIYGRKKLGLRTDRVNLTRTGALAKSRYYDSTRKELRYGESEIAGYLQDGTRNMKARKFVGISKLDEPVILERIEKAFKQKFG